MREIAEPCGQDFGIRQRGIGSFTNVVYNPDRGGELLQRLGIGLRVEMFSPPLIMLVR